MPRAHMYKFKVVRVRDGKVKHAEASKPLIAARKAFRLQAPYYYAAFVRGPGCCGCCGSCRPGCCEVRVYQGKKLVCVCSIAEYG